MSSELPDHPLTLNDVAYYPQLEFPQQVAKGILKATLESEIT